MKTFWNTRFFRFKSERKIVKVNLRNQPILQQDSEQ